MTAPTKSAAAENGPEVFPGAHIKEGVRTMLINRISWGAVLAGVVVALVVQLILNLFGIGIGAASFDLTAGNSPSGSTFSMATGVWWALSGILAALAGGYAAGRLSGQTSHTAGQWHGLMAWAVTTLLVFYLLSTSVGAVVGGAFRTLGNVVGGAAQTLGTPAQTAAQMAAPTLARNADPFAAIEQSVRDAGGGNDPAALRDAATSAIRAAVTSDVSTAEEARERAVRALAKAQNTPVEQARSQVAQYEQQYKQVVQEAKRQAVAAANATASTVSRGALFGAIALIFGALAGWFGGRLGIVDPAELSASFARWRH